MTKKYCALPFNHVNVNSSGDYQICCQHTVPEPHRKNIKIVSNKEWQKNQYLNEVRHWFEQGAEHPGCHRCWEQESANTNSLRQLQTKEYQILGATQFQQKLMNIEISIGNLCNLTCIMCDERFSSAILAENRRLNIVTSNQENFAWNDAAFDHLQQMLEAKPKVINLRGGEPMYNKKILNIINNLSESDLKHTMLHLSTNATRWSDEWELALKKFRLVRMMLSIDAIGNLYEYIRYPAKFSQVEENIKKIKKCSNIKTVIHAVIQNLNIGKIGELVQWAKEMDVYLMMDLLTHPRHLQITNLPMHLKQQAIDHLDDTLCLELDPYVRKELSEYKNILKNAITNSTDDQLWQFFVNQISIRDNLRENSHKNFLEY